MADTQQPSAPQRPLLFGEALPFLHAQSNRNGKFALGSLGGRYVLICAIRDIEAPADLVYRMGFNPLHARVMRGVSV